MDISRDGIIIVNDQTIEYVNDKFIEQQQVFILQAIIDYVEVNIEKTFQKLWNKLKKIRKPKIEMSKKQMLANKKLLEVQMFKRYDILSYEVIQLEDPGVSINDFIWNEIDPMNIYKIDGNDDFFFQIKTTPLNEDEHNTIMIQFINITNTVQCK